MASEVYFRSVRKTLCKPRMTNPMPCTSNNMGIKLLWLALQELNETKKQNNLQLKKTFLYVSIITIKHSKTKTKIKTKQSIVYIQICPLTKSTANHSSDGLCGRHICSVMTKHRLWFPWSLITTWEIVNPLPFHSCTPPPPPLWIMMDAS